MRPKPGPRTCSVGQALITLVNGNFQTHDSRGQYLKEGIRLERGAAKDRRISKAKRSTRSHVELPQVLGSLHALADVVLRRHMITP